MLTVPEAARRIGRNPETVRRWIRSGRLRAERVGTQHLVDERELQIAAAPDLSEIPAPFDRFDDGTAQPHWESLVRDQRRGH